jgi:PAS domain S-box-containing protein
MNISTKLLRDPSLIPVPVRYGMTVGLVAVAVGISLGLLEMLAVMPFALYYGVVAIACWWGGIGTGLLASVLSPLAVDYFLIDPIGAVLSNPADLTHLIVFMLVAGLIIRIDHSRRQNLIRVGQVRDELQSLLDNTVDAITAQGPDGEVVFANKAAALLTGYPSVEALVSQDVSRMQQRFEMIDDHGEPVPYERLPRHKVFNEGVGDSLRFRMRNVNDQTERWVHLATAPIFDHKQKPRLAVNIFRDVTDIMQQQNRLRQMLDNLPVLVGVMSVEGILTEANHAALELAGLKREDVLGKPFEQTYWWSYSEVVQTRLRHAIQRAAAGKTIRYDAVVRTGENKFVSIDFMISPISDETGEIAFLLPSAIDITERLRSQQERQALNTQMDRERARLEIILSNIPGIVWEGVGKPDGTQKVVYVNGHAEKMLGYPVSEWYDNPRIWQDLVVEEDMPGAVEQAMKIFQDNKPGIIEFRLKHANGTLIPVEAYATRIGDVTDEDTHMCGVIMNVSDRKRTEALLRRYAARLKSSNEELQQFAYIASHDMQEPLRMISSYLQLIESRYNHVLDDDGREFIAFAVDGANRMKRLIQDLLAYSRVETRRGTYSDVDLNAVVQQVDTMLAVTIADTQAKLEVGPLPCLHAEQGQMMQLFQNLISNALKFRGEEPPRISISAEQTGGLWQFTVKDNGIGIEPQYQERIFVIFQRLHGVGKYSGTGIGLAICKRVVEHHGGRIWFESQPGQGTTFHFTLANQTQGDSDDEGEYY